MNTTTSRPNAFSNMNKPRYTPANTEAGYRSWKTDVKKEQKKEINMSSFTEFPDLVKQEVKKTIFDGSSLASKLKDVIAAEEEAAIQKRLKKGETPESILRESCTILPLKGYDKNAEPLVAPWWVTDSSKPVILPLPKQKSLNELAEEQWFKRHGISPRNTMLYDDFEEPDDVSLPADDYEEEEEDYDEYN